MNSVRWQTIFRILVILALLYGANRLTYELIEALDFELRPSNEDVVHRVITISALLYSGLLALPFVPGAEIGIALLATFGPPIAFLVYACTVSGLLLSFVIGRFVPAEALARLAEFVRLSRLSDLLREIEPLNQQDRAALLARNAPNRTVSAFLRHRYVGLALLLNVPGNFLIGGGGGIGLIAGMSRLFSVTGYLATVMIAVSPVPIVVSIFGKGFLD